MEVPLRKLNLAVCSQYSLLGPYSVSFFHAGSSCRCFLLFLLQPGSALGHDRNENLTKQLLLVDLAIVCAGTFMQWWACGGQRAPFGVTSFPSVTWGICHLNAGSQAFSQARLPDELSHQPGSLISVSTTYLVVKSSFRP